MKVNDIVCEKRGVWAPYGRVMKIIDKETVEVIDCTKHQTIYKISDLEIDNDYEGFWSRKKFYPMPSLHALKIRRTNFLKRFKI